VSPTQPGPTARPRRSELVRQSILEILTDHGAPLSTRQLEAAHGEFGQYTYTQLCALERRNLVVRQRTIWAASRSVYWHLAAAAADRCGVEDCPGVGVAYVPPVTTDEWIRDGSRAQWRDIAEIPGTGGWACGDPEHAAIMMTRSFQHAREQAATASPLPAGAAS
jgi:hypothetical protein